MVLARSVAVELPAYNERENLLRLVPSFHPVLKAYDHEIVVDDNSPDGTMMAMHSTVDVLRSHEYL